MAPFIRETGRMARPMEEEYLYTLTGIFMMEIGKMIRHMAMEFIKDTMEVSMKVTGKMIFNTAMALKPGLMEINTKGITDLATKKEKASISGRIAAGIQDIGQIML